MVQDQQQQQPPLEDPVSILKGTLGHQQIVHCLFLQMPIIPYSDSLILAHSFAYMHADATTEYLAGISQLAVRLKGAVD